MTNPSGCSRSVATLIRSFKLKQKKDNRLWEWRNSRFFWESFEYLMMDISSNVSRQISSEVKVVNIKRRLPKYQLAVDAVLEAVTVSVIMYSSNFQCGILFWWRSFQCSKRMLVFKQSWTCLFITNSHYLVFCTAVTKTISSHPVQRYFPLPSLRVWDQLNGAVPRCYMKYRNVTYQRFTVYQNVWRHSRWCIEYMAPFTLIVLTE